MLRSGAIGFVTGLATLGVVAHGSPAHALFSGTTSSVKALAGTNDAPRTARKHPAQQQDPWLAPQDSHAQSQQDPYAQPHYQQPQQQQYVQPAPSQPPQSQAS